VQLGDSCGDQSGRSGILGCFSEELAS